MSQERKGERSGERSLYRPRRHLRLRTEPKARRFRARPLGVLGNVVPEPPGPSSLMVVQPVSSPSPCSLGLKGFSASAPCRAWHARAARRVPPAPWLAETCGRLGRSQPAPRRALPSAAPAGAASAAAAAAGAEATPPFRPPRGRGRRRAQPLAGARGTASSPCAASSSSGPPTRLLAPPRGCRDWKPKVRGAGRGRDLPGPELSSSPAEDSPEPVSGLRPIPHLLLRRRDRRRPALPRAGCQVSLGVPVCPAQRPPPPPESLSPSLSYPTAPGVPGLFSQLPYSLRSPCLLLQFPFSPGAPVPLPQLPHSPRSPCLRPSVSLSSLEYLDSSHHP